MLITRLVERSHAFRQPASTYLPNRSALSYLRTESQPLTLHHPHADAIIQLNRLVHGPQLMKPIPAKRAIYRPRLIFANERKVMAMVGRLERVTQLRCDFHGYLGFGYALQS